MHIKLFVLVKCNGDIYEKDFASDNLLFYSYMYK